MPSSKERKYFKIAWTITRFQAFLQDASNLPPTPLDIKKCMELLQTHLLSMP